MGAKHGIVYPMVIPVGLRTEALVADAASPVWLLSDQLVGFVEADK